MQNLKIKEAIELSHKVYKCSLNCEQCHCFSEKIGSCGLLCGMTFFPQTTEEYIEHINRVFVRGVF